jgi:hypothetical protein
MLKLAPLAMTSGASATGWRVDLPFAHIVLARVYAKRIVASFKRSRFYGRGSLPHRQPLVTDPEDLARSNCTYRLSQAKRSPKSNAMFFAFRNFTTDHRWSTVT